jgi:cell division protein FtsQ
MSTRLAPVAVDFMPEKGAAVRRAQAQGRGARLRAVLVALVRTAAAMAISALLCLGCLRGWEEARRSPFFAVRTIQVRGAIHSTQESLVARSGLLAGQNIFRVDLAAAARGVESSPWVISASLSRRLPGTLEIEVVEHAPALVLQLGTPYLVDGEGLVFKRVAAEDAPLAERLTKVTGWGRADWESQRELVSQRLLTALRFCEAWQEEGLGLRGERGSAGGPLLELRFDDASALTAFSREESGVQEIRVGQGPFPERLHRLLQVRAALQRRGESASRIDLDNQARPDTVAAQIIRDPEHPARRPTGRGREE